jgi:DNA polymerase-3 subunit alpha
VRVDEWRNEPGNYKLNILNMMLLSDVREKMTKRIELNINLNDLSEDFIKQLSNLIKSHPGNCALQFKIRDVVEEIQVELTSPRARISLDEQIIQFIEKEPKIKYNLN